MSVQQSHVGVLLALFLDRKGKGSRLKKHNMFSQSYRASALSKRDLGMDVRGT